MVNPNLPIPNNTTCDIYRATHTPPSAPDVAGVPCVLIPCSQNIKPSTAAPATYSHLLRVAAAVDIRDGGVAGGDTIYVPNQNGVPYRVEWVTRQGRGTAHRPQGSAPDAPEPDLSDERRMISIEDHS